MNVDPIPRRSIARSATVAGVGLHTGATSRLCFHPADPDTGIVFRRIDGAVPYHIPASLDAIHAVDRRTALEANGSRVETVEHVLAAVRGLEIDDVYIELDGPEPPIGDGSSAPFIEALIAAEPVETAGVRRTFSIEGEVTLTAGESTYRVAPGPPEVAVTIEWAHPLIGTQSGRFAITPETFARELASARTFGFVSELEALRKRGLIRGAHGACAVVLSNTEVVAGGLRWPDEFLRHKTLDLIGDLALLGGQVLGVIEARKPSHRGNVALARAIREHCTPHPN